MLTFGASWDNKSDVDFLNRSVAADRDRPGGGGGAGATRSNPFRVGAVSKGKASGKHGGGHRRGLGLLEAFLRYFVSAFWPAIV